MRGSLPPGSSFLAGYPRPDATFFSYLCPSVSLEWRFTNIPVGVPQMAEKGEVTSQNLGFIRSRRCLKAHALSALEHRT